MKMILLTVSSSQKITWCDNWKLLSNDFCCIITESFLKIYASIFLMVNWGQIKNQAEGLITYLKNLNAFKIKYIKFILVAIGWGWPCNGHNAGLPIAEAKPHNGVTKDAGDIQRVSHLHPLIFFLFFKIFLFLKIEK